jgi:hypothetical protein
MRNLLGRLHERSPSSLAGIARAWGVELRGRDVHQDVGQLFRVMTDPWSFSIAVERLDPAPRRLLFRLAEIRQTQTGHEIAAALEVDFDAVRDSLRTLYRAGFVYDEQSEMGVDDRGEARLLVPRELVALSSRLEEERTQPDPDACTLPELLERLDDPDLAEIASAHGYTVVPTVALRADLIEYIRPRLSDPDRLSRARQALTGATARLSEWLETVGRSYPESARSSLELSHDDLRGAIWDLAALGLIWRGYDDSGKLEIVFPSVIREPEPVPKTPAPSLVEIPETEIDSPEWIFPYAICWDLLTVLRESQIGQTQALARMLRDGGHGLSAAATDRLAPMLWLASTDGDHGGTIPTGYLWFLSALATSEHLIDDQDPPGMTDHVRPWTRHDFPTQHRRLVGHWQRWTHWYEARGRDSVDVWGARWADFRAALSADLARLDLDHWYTVASFAERFAAEQGDALGTQFSAALNREHVDESLGARRRDVVRFVTEMTMLTAGVWLGLIEISRSRRRGYVFRLTRVGQWVLNDPEQNESPEIDAFGEHPVAVQANYEIFLTGPQPRLIWAISGFADLLELDRVTRFRVTESSIHRAIDAGASVEQLLKALVRYSGNPVPENVAADMQEWAETYRRARISRGLMVQLSHAGELERLSDALSAQGLTVEPASNDRLFVRVISADRDEATARVLRTVLSDLGIAARWG